MRKMILIAAVLLAMVAAWLVFDYFRLYLIRFSLILPLPNWLRLILWGW